VADAIRAYGDGSVVAEEALSELLAEFDAAAGAGVEADFLCFPSIAALIDELLGAYRHRQVLEERLLATPEHGLDVVSAAHLIVLKADASSRRGAC